MNSKKVLVVTGLYITALLIIFVFAQVSNETETNRLLNIIVVVLFSLLLLFYLIANNYVKKEKRKLTVQIEKLLVQKDYDTSIKLLENKIKSYWFGSNVLYAKLLHLITYLLANKNDLAKKLLSQTKWYKYHKNTLYIQVLFALDEGNITEAKKFNEKLAKIKHRNLLQHQIMSKSIIAFVESGKPNKAIIKTYPLVEKIYRKYVKE